MRQRCQRLSFLVGVLVSFSEATYLADEDQGTVEVCLSLAGQLDRNLNVTISTISGSATGSYIVDSLAQFSTFRETPYPQL